MAPLVGVAALEVMVVEGAKVTIPVVEAVGRTMVEVVAFEPAVGAGPVGKGSAPLIIK